MYLCIKDRNKSKYQYPKALIEYSNNIQDVYETVKVCNLGRKYNALIVFDEMVGDIINNIKLNQVVTQLFIREGSISTKYF